MGAKMFSNSSNREVPAANKKSNSWRVGGFKLPSPGSKAGSDNLLSPNMPSARSTPSSTKNHRSPKNRRSPKSTSVRSTGFATREPEGLPRSIPEDQEVAEDQLPEVPEQVDSKGRTKIGADGMTSRQTSSLGMSSAASYSDEEDEDQDSELSSAFSSVSSAKSSNDYQQ
uniref:Uncharacterized protein n=1 Tax=Heterosigma akashiwo TaxID=2829 RepID=A0A7S3UXH1_HETAK|mmetsp:Transcript_45651/g.66648  ORF Transcript_45651/g.66648 Transcript_45651/m.66648 type:complete len:170 (-) Transcript_45651:175-684(-)